MMNSNPADDVLDDLLKEFNITLMNKYIGIAYFGVPVYGGNTMEQLLNEYGEDIGIVPGCYRIRFMNQRTGDETCSFTCSVRDLGLKQGDVLFFIEDCFVI